MRFRSIALLSSSVTLALGLLGCGIDIQPASEESTTNKGPFAVLFQIDGEMPTFANPSDMFGALSTSQHRFLDLLEKASGDLNVQEVVVHVGSPAVSLARAEEIAEALQAVAARGKPLVCHIDSVGNIGYWIAAKACPKILVSPAGGVETLGLSLEAVYLRDLLSSLGIVADIIHIGEYKDAAEPLTRSEMSDHAREASEGVLFELHRLLVEGIAAGRNIDTTKTQELLDNGPYNAEQAVVNGLADEVKTLRSHLDSLEAKYPGGVNYDYGKKPARPFSLTDIFQLFGEKPKKEDTPGPKIALVPLVGPIVGGRRSEMMGGVDTVFEMDVTRALSDIARDDSVRAVVMRIESPGGSPLASDNIWLAVRAVAEKKPVVASLGDVAASGGYYIASGATEVVAEPGTLTGSIGVVGGKLVFTEAAKKLGINTERIQGGRRAGLNSPFSEFNEDERGAIEILMKSCYDLFVKRVVEGRGLEPDKVLAAAKGRVWTGSQAHRIGLVGRLGSLKEALTRAEKLASLPAGTEVELRPKPRSFMEVLGEALSEPRVSLHRSLAQRHPSLKQSLALAFLLLDEKVLAYLPVHFGVN